MHGQITQNQLVEKILSVCLNQYQMLRLNATAIRDAVEFCLFFGTENMRR